VTSDFWSKKFPCRIYDKLVLWDDIPCVDVSFQSDRRSTNFYARRQLTVERNSYATNGRSARYGYGRNRIRLLRHVNHQSLSRAFTNRIYKGDRRRNFSNGVFTDLIGTVSQRGGESTRFTSNGHWPPPPPPPPAGPLTGRRTAQPG
jgi:hypothetical protein